MPIAELIEVPVPTIVLVVEPEPAAEAVGGIVVVGLGVPVALAVPLLVAEAVQEGAMGVPGGQVPQMQGRQVAIVVAPSAAEEVPAGHSMGLTEEKGQNAPAGQIMGTPEEQ